MKNSMETIQFVENLAKTIKQSVQSGNRNWDILLRKVLTDIMPLLTTLKNEEAVSMGKSKTLEYIAGNSAGFFEKFSPIIMNKLMVELNDQFQNDLAKEILFIFYYILVLIGDFKKSDEFFKTKISYSLSNPPEDFWFQRVDIKGTHEFNTKDGIYLINSIPIADNKHYINSEIYNSPYTSISPLNVIANPFPVEEITDLIELKNFLYDLFLNNPFASSQNLVLSAKIKAENLLGGSRGWGFWNTVPIPIIGMKIAWFMQQNDGNPKNPNNGFFAHTISGAKLLPPIKLPDLDENWHEYKIVLNQQSVEYFIDEKSMGKIIDPEVIPNAPMAFHNWVDNACFNVNEKGFTKDFQSTNAPRRNYTKYINISTQD